MTSQLLDKFCQRCQTRKALSEFYFIYTRGVYQSHCKACDSLKKKQRLRDCPGAREKAILRHRNYYANNRERQKERWRQWKQRSGYRADDRDDPVKIKARNVLRDAVRFGKIIKPTTCEACKQPTAINRIHGHHADYSKPLDVKWLCVACHAFVHRTVIDLQPVETEQ